jgi:hemin uptake protein HemP
MKPHLNTPSAHRPPPPQLAPIPQIESTTLLGPHQGIDILHAGEIYRLRRTRQGKLILTK